ncbi:hypothetical protein [Catenulispora subtropica]|uniref:Uncharacterized protein n=1 Tax=Catenulispora subtropica TaxID=450798 RepID=A0ABN2SV41_9ACTN
MASAAVSAVRKAKTEAKVSMRADVAVAVIAGPASFTEAVREFEADLKAAGHIGEVTYAVDDDISVTVQL